MKYDDDDEEVGEVENEDISLEPPNGDITITVNLDSWTDGSMHDKMVSLVSRRLTNVLEKTIADAVKEKVLALVDAEFEAIAAAKLEEFFDGELFKTSQWGERTGKPTSLREMLLKQNEDFLAEKVRNDGNATGYRDGGKAKTRGEWAVLKMANQAMKEAVEETVAKISTEAKKQVQASVSRYIAEQLTPAISVPAPQLSNSEDDHE